MQRGLKQSRDLALYILRSLGNLRVEAHAAGLDEMAEILDKAYYTCRAHLNLVDGRAPNGQPDHRIGPKSLNSTGTGLDGRADEAEAINNESAMKPGC